jgi:hypothetical protein
VHQATAIEGKRAPQFGRPADLRRFPSERVQASQGTDCGRTPILGLREPLAIGSKRSDGAIGERANTRRIGGCRVARRRRWDRRGSTVAAQGDDAGLGGHDQHAVARGETRGDRALPVCARGGRGGREQRPGREVDAVNAAGIVSRVDHAVGDQWSAHERGRRRKTPALRERVAITGDECSRLAQHGQVAGEGGVGALVASDRGTRRWVELLATRVRSRPDALAVE